jgi:hypothetical protein
VVKDYKQICKNYFKLLNLIKNHNQMNNEKDSNCWYELKEPKPHKDVTIINAKWILIIMLIVFVIAWILLDFVDR